jgi:hypothetical protein
MILIATISLTLLHPGPCFQGAWQTRAVLLETQQQSGDVGDHTSENSKQPNVTIHELHSRLDSLLHTERSRAPSAYHVLDH